MKLTASKLRQNIYQILGSVLKTGRAIEIELKGKSLLISPISPKNKLDTLEIRPIIKGDPEDLVHMDWTHEWKPKLK